MLSHLRSQIGKLNIKKTFFFLKAMYTFNVTSVKIQMEKKKKKKIQMGLSFWEKSLFVAMYPKVLGEA